MSIATEISRLQTAKADIKTSIENKGVEVDASTTIDEYAGYVDQIETGTTIVNGVIKNYLASTSTVNAGTFVEFVNTIGTMTQLEGSNTSISAEAVALEDGKVFVAFRKGSSGSRYAVIATISNGAVSFETEVLLSTSSSISYNSDTYAAASPDKSKVLVSWTGNDSTVRVVCCSVSGTTITTGTEVSSAGAGTQGVEWLNNSRAFWGIASSSTTATGILLTVASNLSITAGTATVINSTTGTFDMKVLSPTRVVFVEHFVTGTSSAASIYAYHATINSTTISLSSRVAIAVGAISSFYALNSGSRGTLVRINSTHAATLFVGRPYGRTAGISLWSCRLSAGGSSVSPVGGNEVFGYGSTNSYTSQVSGVRAFQGSDGPYAVINYDSGKLQLAKLRTTVAGVAIKEFRNFATSNSSAVGTCGGAIIGANGLLFYSVSAYLYAYPLMAKVKRAEIEISGLTKTEAATSTPGEVWALGS